jgi:type 1 glutamine amidotransferase
VIAVAHALILSGGGAYADPWHPFAQTSERIAAILRDAGFDAQIREDVEDALVDLSDVDLVVTNAAAGPDSDRRAVARNGMLAYLERGGGVLAVHVGTAGLVAIPEWEEVVGMAWVDGESSHTPVGLSSVLVYPDRHPIAAPLTGFDVHDELYRDLRLSGQVVPLVAHEEQGRIHPLVWARHYGPAPIVVDTLGHDAASFDSPEHRTIIGRGALWAAGRPLD